VRVLVPNGARPSLYLSVPSAVEAPVRAGERIGSAYVWADGRTLAAVPLYAAASVARRPVALPPLMERIWRSLFRYPR